MPGELLYLDSSALVKLILAEDESSALRKELARWPHRLSSDLARIEVLRATRKASQDIEVRRKSEQVLAGLDLLRIDEQIVTLAADLEPPGLRSLDALHLASALSLGSDLGGLVVYDFRLAEAARLHGLRVVVPS